MQPLNVESTRTFYSLLTVASARYRSRFCMGRSSLIASGHNHRLVQNTGRSSGLNPIN